MVLERTYIIPHGDEILSLPNAESKLMNRAISKVTRGDNSETILIISPHSLRIPNGLPVINTEYLSGRYRIGKVTIRGDYKTDKVLNSRLVKASKRFMETNFVTTEGRLSKFPVDFGTLIPLTFFGKRSISMLGQWRTSNKSELMELGRKLYGVVSNVEQRVSVVFSADQAHAHLKTGPYGYDPRAEKYDRLVIDSIKNNSFDSLIKLNEDYLNGAKPDSYWNVLMFLGFVEAGGLVPRFHYYYLQEYFGMLLATAEIQRKN